MINFFSLTLLRILSQGIIKKINVKKKKLNIGVQHI